MFPLRFGLILFLSFLVLLHSFVHFSYYRVRNFYYASSRGKFLNAAKQNSRNKLEITGKHDKINTFGMSHGEHEAREPSKTLQYIRDYSIILIGLPLISTIFPYFLDRITDPNTFSSERQIYIIALLLSKRIFLYWTAFAALVISAERSASTMNDTALGKRLERITAEVYEGLITMPSESSDPKSESKILYNQLDKVTSTSQAVILPILVSISLLVSYLFLGFSNASPPDTSGVSVGMLLSALATLTNMGVAFLFTKTEFRWLFSQFSASTKSSLLIATISAALLTLTAFSFAPGAGPWPIQNIVNFCIAVTMARALQLPQLSAILLALTGLTAYDFLAVIGSQQFTDGGASIMESVARAKIGMEGAVSPSVTATIGADFSHSMSAMASSSSISEFVGTALERVKAIFSPSSWRPGLFEVAVGGRVSDVLGIADVLFPSLLASWALRFDRRPETETNTSSILDQKGQDWTPTAVNTPTFSAVCTGFVIGCVLCEVFQTGQGQPALIYIVPATVSMLAITALRRNEFPDMWAFGNDDPQQ